MYRFVDSIHSPNIRNIRHELATRFPESMRQGLAYKPHASVLSYGAIFDQILRATGRGSPTEDVKTKALHARRSIFANLPKTKDAPLYVRTQTVDLKEGAGRVHVFLNLVSPELEFEQDQAFNLLEAESGRQVKWPINPHILIGQVENAHLKMPIISEVEDHALSLCAQHLPRTREILLGAVTLRTP